MDVKEVVEETLPPKFIYMERKMKENKLKWYIADKEYVNYLRQFDEKVEFVVCKIRQNKRFEGFTKF